MQGVAAFAACLLDVEAEVKPSRVIELPVLQCINMYGSCTLIWDVLIFH